MNKSEFITLIENPESLGKEQVSALKEIAADFPYFQAVQVLLAKALFNQNHYEFEKQLKHTALVVPDREVLYRFMNQQVAKEGEKVAVSVIPEVTLPVIEDVVTIEEETVIPTPTETLSVTDEKVEALSESAEDIIIAEEVVYEESPTVPLVIEPSVTIVEPIEPVNEELHVSETTFPLDEGQFAEPLAEVVISEPEAEQSQESSQENIETHKNEVHSFAEWLQLTRPGHVTSESPDAEKPGEEKEKVAEEKKKIEPVKEEPVKAEVPQELPEEHKGKSNILELESLLDRFIKESPSISRPKAEFYSPQNMAKQSIEEDEDLVTETLANVYYKQGNYKKAIRAYEKLCLIYPHKMAYFADLIRKIKQEVKD